MLSYRWIISSFGLPNDYFIHAISMPQVRHKLEEQSKLMPNTNFFLILYLAIGCF